MKFSAVFPKFSFYPVPFFGGYSLDIEMNEEVAQSLSTEQAIKFSVQKFEKSLKVIQGLDDEEGFFPRFGVTTCPLCAKFWKYEHNTVFCDGCPIKKFTGLDGCVGTPYPQLEESYDVGEHKINLQKEIDFLKSLKP